jgi:hypothetical protein
METTLYVVKREDGRCVIVPFPLHAGLMPGLFGAGSAFLVYLSTLFFRRTDTAIFGALFLLVAVLPAGLGIRAWRTRRTPHTIERGGRVSYGDRELCAAGTIRAIRIALLGGTWAIECEVCLELDGGKLVPIPSQYFAEFPASEHARPFAQELAEALGVPVIEGGQ